MLGSGQVSYVKLSLRRRMSLLNFCDPRPLKLEFTPLVVLGPPSRDFQRGFDWIGLGQLLADQGFAQGGGRRQHCHEAEGVVYECFGAHPAMVQAVWSDNMAKAEWRLRCCKPARWRNSASSS